MVWTAVARRAIWRQVFNATAASLPANWSFALWNGDPGETGATGTEVTGTIGLARASVARGTGTFDLAAAAATAATQNTSDISFGTPSGGGSADYICLFNGSTLWAADLIRNSGGTPTALTILSGQEVRIAASEGVWRLSGYVNSFNALLLNWLFRGASLPADAAMAVAAYSAQPAADGTGGTEVTGTNGLTRISLTRGTTDWNDATAGGSGVQVVVDNASAETFGTLTGGVTTNSMQVFWGSQAVCNDTWDTSRTGVSGDTIDLAAGDLNLRF